MQPKVRKSTQRNVLMLCYYYPPLTNVGCRRSVAFSKYFQKYGWKPVVVSIRNPDKNFCMIGNDVPPEGIDVYYSYSLVNTYWFLGKMNGLLTRFLRPVGIQPKRNYFYDLINIPDHFWGWILSTFVKGWRLIRKLDIDVIYVSCPPFSSAVVGVLLKKVTKKPLVVDFRDPFGLKIPPYIPKNMPLFRRKIIWGLERWFFTNADIIVVTHDEVRKLYLEQYPQIENKLFAIYNGIEPEYFKLDEMDTFEKFTVVYGGNYYLHIIKTDIFFEAIQNLKLLNKINSENFQFLYYGSDQDQLQIKAKEYGIEELVITNAAIPYKSMLIITSRADLMLLRLFKPAMGTKIFDGIVLNVPLLATIPGGETWDLILKYSPNSYLVGNESSERVSNALLDAMENRLQLRQKRSAQNSAFIREFSREAQTKKIMQIIEDVIFSKRNGI